MTIKMNQHDWGARNSNGSATCQKCGVYCPCNRIVLDKDYFFISEDCTIHKDLNMAKKCPPQLDLAI